MHPSNVMKLPSKAELFYKTVIKTLQREKAQFLVGGSLALAHYMHLPRCPKDMDLFLTREQCLKVLEILEQRGYKTEMLHPHWLAKAYKDEFFIDLIFSSGNGIAQVNSDWYEHASKTTLFGLEVALCAPEEILWSKAFIMDRERFDGADIAHLIHDAGEQLDWCRLLKRFGEHWRILMSHLIIFQYIYPSKRSNIPDWVIDTLLMRVAAELRQSNSGNGMKQPICNGTLLSRDQYLCDVERHKYADGRLAPSGGMQEEELADYIQTFRAIQMREAEEKKAQDAPAIADANQDNAGASPLPVRRGKKKDAA